MFAMCFLTETDRYLFGNGAHYEIYEKLGAHVTEVNGERGTYFAVWAPHAVAVSVVGNFNNWDRYRHFMTCIDTSGIWDIFIPGVVEGEIYKFAVEGRDHQVHLKADPFGNYSEMRPGNASRVTSLKGYEWNDAAWIEEKNEANKIDTAMSIYEVHLGSWKKDYSYSVDGYCGYKQLAHELAEYVKYMGYTHVELMGIAEHPFDGSWGYQVTGYYAPTSRHGEPKDFMYFVDYMHQQGIGVILDWVPAHFPRDEHGLAMFDGTPTYEYADPRKGEHPDWGTKIFDYEKSEVKNFLIANALFWIEKFHVDGLRVDAVASMLYLDYGRRDGQWVPNKYGGNGNLEAMEFFRHLNSIISKRAPRAYVIAEESTAWPKVTKPAEEEGLGFTFKWNMGWMHDFLEYVKLDPYFKKYNHNKMTFNMTYTFSENFILVLSHDEVVHLKCSMLQKMPGIYEDKFANLKTAYTFMIGQPGKKLLFMGQDFGQWEEWTETKSLDWHLCNEPLHKDLQDYMKKLLHLYKENPVMHAYESSEYGCFEWINCDDGENSVFSFIRKEPDTFNNSLAFVCNFTPMERKEYTIGVPNFGTYEVILSSSNVNGEGEVVKYKAVKDPCDNFPYSIKVDLRPFESIVMKTPYMAPKKKDAKKKAESKKEEK
ncbi:MAG: 1,4-alpha-glucan branching protein GlgB [Lachnospiraceae bacterium]|nr:1,4-alpha-glucan branching protein GlgB [Lachnospiraceae bacterium]